MVVFPTGSTLQTVDQLKDNMGPVCRAVYYYTQLIYNTFNQCRLDVGPASQPMGK